MGVQIANGSVNVNGGTVLVTSNPTAVVSPSYPGGLCNAGNITLSKGDTMECENTGNITNNGGVATFKNTGNITNNGGTL